ncbi:formate/nitrite transporter family protein [Clostridium sp. SM-530-WT-3G]|uniref:formate/nitrite transporter family protein n=1 Tax=Clostridium sp. SM-530-WT-3G TaxID=2725303 RepID=UPI00145CC41A|nr:formate/nitrite transporter family protein [Clostridium sp. SM-530-WT-3G]NME82043.1 formate/nitrite transporter family protein [Clostridium sp. SM-530-WT-3G]
MYDSDIESMANSAVSKVEIANGSLVKYFARAIMAGVFILFATVLSNVVGAILSKNFPEAARISGAALFSFAIIAVVLLGGELFTGNNLVMFIGIIKKKVSIGSTAKIWIYSFIGNFIGIFIFAYIFVASGASMDIVKSYVEPVVHTKVSLSAIQLVFRGILCNFSVCLAVYSGVRLKSETAKIILMFLCVFTFVVAGFEHCIANMATFSVAYFATGSLPAAGVLHNMIWVVVGNIIGGGVLLGGLLYISSIKDK